MKHFVWSIFIYYWIDGASGTRTFPVIKHCAQLLLKSYWEAKCMYIAQKEEFILEVVEKQRKTSVFQVIWISLEELLLHMLYSYHVYFRIKFSLNTLAIHLASIYFTYFFFHSSSAAQFCFVFEKCSHQQYHNRNEGCLGGFVG